MVSNSYNPGKYNQDIIATLSSYGEIYDVISGYEFSGNITGKIKINDNSFFFKAHSNLSKKDNINNEINTLSLLKNIDLLPSKMYPRIHKVIQSDEFNLSIILMSLVICDEYMAHDRFLKGIYMCIDLHRRDISSYIGDYNFQQVIIQKNFLGDKSLQNLFQAMESRNRGVYLVHNDVCIRHVIGDTLVDWENAHITNVPGKDLAHLFTQTLQQREINISEGDYLKLIQNYYYCNDTHYICSFQTLIRGYRFWLQYYIQKGTSQN